MILHRGPRRATLVRDQDQLLYLVIRPTGKTRLDSTYPMWGQRAKAHLYGNNADAAQWAERQSLERGYPRRIRAVLVFMATKMDGLWCSFRDCIARIMEATDYSRSSVCEALSVLRKDKVVAYDGQIHVGQRRPVAKYRLVSCPDFPFPENVSEALEESWQLSREEPPEWESVEDVFAGQGQLRTKNLQTGPAVYVEPQSASPSEEISQSWSGAGQYPSALPTRTGLEAEPQPSGSARRVPHLGPAPSRATVRKLARSTAKRLLEGFMGPKTPETPAAPEGRSRALSQAGCSLSSVIKIAVTYSPPATEGTPPMTPFTDPALGALDRDTRLFYLGLRSIADTGMTLADPRYLKAELFRYDDDINVTDVGNMINTLIDAGKLHPIPGHLVLSDPEVTADGGLFAIPAAPKPLKNNPEQEFNTFWACYPRRTGKGAARKAFLAAVARGVPAARIIEAAAAYRDNCQLIRKEAQFIPHPSTWLGQERWEDDVEQAPQVRSRVDDAFHHNMMMVEEYRRAEIQNNNGNAPKEIGPSW